MENSCTCTCGSVAMDTGLGDFPTACSTQPIPVTVLVALLLLMTKLRQPLLRSLTALTASLCSTLDRLCPLTDSTTSPTLSEQLGMEACSEHGNGDSCTQVRCTDYQFITCMRTPQPLLCLAAWDDLGDDDCVWVWQLRLVPPSHNGKASTTIMVLCVGRGGMRGVGER